LKQAGQQDSAARTVIRQRLRDYADQVSEIIWIMDETGQCIYLNRAWSDFTGQDPTTGLGTLWLNQVHPDDRSAAMRSYESATARRSLYQARLRLRHVTRGYLTVIDCGHPYFGAEGELLGYMGTALPLEASHAQTSAFGHMSPYDREIINQLASNAHRGESLPPRSTPDKLPGLPRFLKSRS
jgi:PAS domain S-box-containing protein